MKLSLSKAKLFCTTALASAFMAVSAFASESSLDISTVMGTATESTKTEMMSVIGVALPVVAAIMAAVISVKFGLRFFKSATSSTT